MNMSGHTIHDTASIRQLIRQFSANNPFGKQSHAILERLSADHDGKVSAALTRLKWSEQNEKILLHYVVQAGMLVEQRSNAEEVYKESAAGWEADAKALIEIMNRRQEWLPLHLSETSKELIRYFKEQALWNEAAPGRLNMSRKDKSSPALLALRHLRKNLFAPTDRVPEKTKAALGFLIEAALDITILPGTLAEGLRSPKINLGV